MNNNKPTLLFLFSVCCLLMTSCSQAEDATCLEISLTGTMGGPAAFEGLAGSGTLVKYGSVENNCGDVNLQFDAGRATGLRLSELGVGANQLDAVFLTHLHSDHTVGLIDIAQTRWHFFGKPLDVVCSADKSTDKPTPRTMSCGSFAEHIGDAAIAGGEIAQRSAESKKRDTSGPASAIKFIPVDATPASKSEPAKAVQVWASGDVKVSAIASQHIPGHLSYRVDTPKGSVVIGGDAGNSVTKPPRANSTSASVEALSQGADVLVHSTIHTIFGPDGGSTFPAPIFFRQSTATDLGAMAERAKVPHLMLTHLIPALGAKSHGPFAVPGGALNKADYEKSAKNGGYKGQLHVGTDRLTLRLPLASKN